MPTNKNVMQHIDDLVNGIFDSTVMTILELGHFIIKIIGIEDIILDDNTKQTEAIEQAEVFWEAIELMVLNDKAREKIFQLLKQDFQKQPLYYIGSIVGPGAVVALIKKPTQKIIYFGINKTQQTFNLSTHTLYPYYKNIQNSFTPLCFIDNKNNHLLKEFNFDNFSCDFYNTSIFNQSLKYLNSLNDEKNYNYECKIFLEILNRFNQEYNHYKLIPIQAIHNPKIAYIQKLSLHDIDTIHINSEPYLLKALYFCEDYVLLNKNQQASFDKNAIKELEFNSSFYTIFISGKEKLNDTYLQARKKLYKNIDEFKRLSFKDLENAYTLYINSLMTNQENNTTNNKQNFTPLSYRSKSLNHFILENKGKRIIFLDNASSMSNLIHIDDGHCDIFLKDESLLDIKKIEKEYDINFKDLKTQVFFYEKLLLGACENNQFLFENEKENLLYYFKYDKENLKALGDLHIKYNYHNAKIKNYSLLEKSLNITLEFKKEIAYKDTALNQSSKDSLNESSSTLKPPNFITLYLKDEQDKAI
ncbi:MAG: hypothetical protein Q4A76_06250, partial [Porphyromonadaceae bacterium]|nr:hypothetical protein [Porphyromonadaceae bacterium]